MAASPLTIAGRAASARMYVDTFPRIEGNAQLLLLMARRDSAVVAALGEAVAGAASPPPGMAAALASESAMLATLPEWSGNIGLWPRLYAASGNVWNACDFLDAEAANVPRDVGTTIAIGFGVAPLVTMHEAFTPLDPALVNGAAVRVEGSGWASLDGRTFTISNVNAAVGQFRLVEADTTAEETGSGAGATIWFIP